MDNRDCFNSKGESMLNTRRYPYEVIRSVYDANNKLIGYDLKHNKTHQVLYYTQYETNHLIKTGKLLLTEEKLKLISRRITGNSHSVDVRVGKDIVIPRIISTYNKRFLFQDLVDFLGTTGNKICSLYGLRRTGKTVLMQQAINYLDSINELEHVALITINNDNTIGMSDVYHILDDLKRKGIRYVFIDEITFTRDFISSSSNLANVYSSDFRIVITGTDSLGLRFAEEDTLYDRVVRLNTTYISYKEYKQLFPSKDIDDFLRLGGVLTQGVYCSNKGVNEYINTAIYNNICKSLLRYDNGKFFTPLVKLFDDGNLYSALLRTIDRNISKFTISTILRKYENSDLSSAYQILQNKLNLTTEFIEKNIKSVSESFLYYMEIKSWESENELFITQEELTVIQHHLLTLGVLTVIGEEVIISQSGLRYFKAKELIKVLLDNEEFKSLDEIKREMIADTITGDVSGRILEDSVLLDTFKSLDPSIYIVRKFTLGSKEVDMLVLDKTTKFVYLFEIKLSDKVVDKQYRWLIDSEISDYIFKEYDGIIVKRSVLYRGITKSIHLGESMNIDYINVEEFLNDIQSYF